MRAVALLIAMLFATAALAADDVRTCSDWTVPPADEIAACSALLDSKPMTSAQMADVFLERSQAHLRAHNNFSAMADAKSVLELSGGARIASSAHLFLAIAELRLGRLDAVRSDSKAALALDPDARSAYELLGIVEADANHHRKAEAYFTAAIKHGFAAPSVLLRRSAERTILGNKAGAAADLAWAKEEDPRLGDKPAPPALP